MNNSILNRINIPVLIVVLTLLITGTGISQTGVGTAVVDNSHRSISSADTVFEYVESFYIGPAAKWDISGVLVLYSKSVWIAPSATITGNGKLVIASPGSNPLYTSMAGSTIIDGNNGQHILLDIQHKNPENILLSDVADPGYGTINPSAEKAAALNIGGDFSFESDGADVLLNGYDFLFGENATLSNYSSQRMVVTGNTVNGHLIKQNSIPAAFTFPVGIAEGDYTPASITGSSEYHVSVTDYSFINSLVTAPEEGMNRAWHIYGGTAASLTLQHNTLSNGLSYVDADAFITQHQSSGVWSNIPSADYVSSGVHSNTTTIPSAIPPTSTPSSWFSKSNDVASPLPIGLLTFNAEKQGRTVELKWITVTEHNNNLFEIERSEDGKTWDNIGKKASLSGGSDGHQQLNYNFFDLKPVIGYNYYRLKQVDYDGKYSYSPVRSVLFNELVIYPVPTKDFLHISGLSGKEIIRIRDLTGREIKSMSNTSSTITTNINLNDLSDGIYYIDIFSDNTIVLSQKIMVTK
ncbi:MAG: T9SS type A sorting domain-containing protein [Flavobacteriia bacterium]|nr:T9SS type A sorting domain-containing protein [Flavobacteriia bacterium]OJX38521.1 MAG: hypothetical protein BGO87_10415 [Flavobacteriia bacterium 40-80]